ncbi:MAG TPA: RNA-binding S4 domain-containing protein [Phenylobacterium sp.]|jgi:ribosomal 50S subunit-recycling heat shock protein|uniref:RNA-binding S4 domain-containing protein n=1 Tax=Phenylobacterium sp. TaxID=1871053 RepID=UPI002D130BE9|nr:RNA-binding S4 domain-containing protein [Phenylobacterium sp.]HXA38083.1 RNA-binding S4 domain-containing protein [Phenylobacterium sp.]
MSDPVPPEATRADVWLWRARFFKTRTLAATFIEEGRIRLTRAGHESRIDKPARPLKVGDALVFALGGKLVAVTVLALGERRGPPKEARTLYSPLEISS